MQIDQAKIEQAIVDEAVRGFVDNDDLYNRIRRGVDDRIDALFRERAQETISGAIDKVIKDGFEREYRKSDGFGRSVGEPTSISKELEELVGNYWTQRVDRNGKVTENSYSSSSRAEWMMMQICADDFSKEMKQHVVNVAGSLKDHFRGVLNQHIGILLSDVFKVNTIQDKALKNHGGSAIIAPPAGPIGQPA